MHWFICIRQNHGLPIAKIQEKLYNITISTVKPLNQERMNRDMKYDYIYSEAVDLITAKKDEGTKFFARDTVCVAVTDNGTLFSAFNEASYTDGKLVNGSSEKAVIKKIADSGNTTIAAMITMNCSEMVPVLPDTECVSELLKLDKHNAATDVVSPNIKYIKVKDLSEYDENGDNTAIEIIELDTTARKKKSDSFSDFNPDFNQVTDDGEKKSETKFLFAKPGQKQQPEQPVYTLEDVVQQYQPVNDGYGINRQQSSQFSAQNPQYMQQGMMNPQYMQQGMMNPQYMQQGMMNPQYMQQGMMNPQYMQQGMMNPQYMQQSMMMPQYSQQESSDKSDENKNGENRNPSADTMNPQYMQQGMMNPQYMQQGMINPQYMQQGMMNPQYMQQGMMNPQYMQQGMMNPQYMQQGMMNPQYMQQNMMNQQYGQRSMMASQYMQNDNNPAGHGPSDGGYQNPPQMPQIQPPPVPQRAEESVTMREMNESLEKLNDLLKNK